MAIRYPLRRSILILSRGCSLPSLLPYLTYTTSILSLLNVLPGCFSEVCPALPAIKGINLTLLSTEPYTMTIRPLRVIEATTLQVNTITSPSNFPLLPPKNPLSSSNALHNNRQPNSSPSGEERLDSYNPAINRIPRACPDKLQGLLAD